MAIQVVPGLAPVQPVPTGQALIGGIQQGMQQKAAREAQQQEMAQKEQQMRLTEANIAGMPEKQDMARQTQQAHLALMHAQAQHLAENPFTLLQHAAEITANKPGTPAAHAADLYMFGAKMKGISTLDPVSKQTEYLRMMISSYGPHSQEATQALDNLNRLKKKDEVMNQWHTAEIAALPKRFSSPLTKVVMEDVAQSQGLAPTGQKWGDLYPGQKGQQAGQPGKQPGQQEQDLNKALGLSPEGLPWTHTLHPDSQQYVQPTQASGHNDEHTQLINNVPTGVQNYVKKMEPNLHNLFNLYKLKKATDVDARQMMGYATNLDKTLQRINIAAPDALQYSGITGSIAHGKDYMEQALTGKMTPKLKNLVKFRADVDQAKDQYVRFFNLSQKPEVAIKVAKQFDRISATTSPELAATALREIETTLKQETETIRQRVTDPTVYTEKLTSSVLGDINKPVTRRTAPERSDWISRAKKANPNMSEDDLSNIYDKKYGGK